MLTLTMIVTNRIVMAGFTAWAIAQFIKVILTLAISRRFDSTRILGSGGMPSSHSALVCAVAVTVGYREGFDSSIFAVIACLAVVVMYDAMGVRRSTGRNAAAINQLMEGLTKEGFNFTITEDHLKELVGHTPVQVFAGALLGIFIGVLMG